MRILVLLSLAGVLAAQTPVKFDAGTISGLPPRNIGSATMSGRIAANAGHTMGGDHYRATKRYAGKYVKRPVYGSSYDGPDHKLAGTRFRFDAVVPGEFLQTLFEPVAGLPLQLVGGRARPDKRDRHHLDCEGRIFRTSELKVGEGTAAGDHEN